jgi:hypothetical protein
MGLYPVAVSQQQYNTQIYIHAKYISHKITPWNKKKTKTKKQITSQSYTNSEGYITANEYSVEKEKAIKRYLIQTLEANWVVRHRYSHIVWIIDLQLAIKLLADRVPPSPRPFSVTGGASAVYNYWWISTAKSLLVVCPADTLRHFTVTDWRTYVYIYIYIYAPRSRAAQLYQQTVCSIFSTSYHL